MKTPFQLIDEIRKSNSAYLLEPDDAFSSIIIQKGLSMQSPEVCELLNCTTNKWLGDLDNQQLMDVWKLLIPKTSRYFKWISKKDKSQKTKHDENIKKIMLVALAMEKSMQDILDIIAINPSFLDDAYNDNISIKHKKNS